MAGQAVVLCPQDTTDLNYSDLLECDGLGFLGKNGTSAEARGLRLHTTLALTSEGIPLGVLKAECLARQELPEEEKDRDWRMVPLEEKETHRWVRSLESCIEAAAGMPGTMVVNVADREGDFFELFARCRDEPRVHLLVRALHDRHTDEELSLFEQVRGSGVQGHLEVTVPRQSARRKQGKREAREKEPSRRAKVAVRYRSCQIHPPQHGLSAKKKPVSAYIIHLVEEDPAPGVEALEWYLLTTLTVDSFETAAKLVGYYCKRWRIEDWHRILKSGCEVEAHAHQTAERLKRAIAVDLVVSYRILMMVLLGREHPELPAGVLFSDIEIKVLTAWGGGKKKVLPPTTVAQALAVLAAMGGYLGRKSDPPVGPKILRRAYTRLTDLCEGFSLSDSGMFPAENSGHG
jgi:hypothetical protein